MLRTWSLPGSVKHLLDAFRPCFTAPGFETFVVLVTGLIAAPARRSVCGMLAAAGADSQWHHSRAHRFFATARWSLDHVGMTVLKLVIGWMIPVGSPVLIAIDDTLFRRSGRKVHAAFWAYDGSVPARGRRQKLSRGNTFVVAAAVVRLPFLDRPIALPVLIRLWRKHGATKTALARELIEVVTAACPDRGVHVVGDGAYICTELRDLPPQATLTGPLPRHAALWDIHPDLENPPRNRGRAGRPRVRGEKIGTPQQLVATTPATPLTLTRYGHTQTITVHERRCLWYGVFRSRPVRVIITAERGKTPYALVTTDPNTPTAVIIERYAARWSIEVTFADAKNTTGAGEARNRTENAVTRTIPFALLTQSIVIIWYHLAGHSPRVTTERRTRAPWYTTKTCPSYLDMIVKFRRVLIACQYRADPASDPTPEQIHTIRLAWSNAAA